MLEQLISQLKSSQFSGVDYMLERIGPNIVQLLETSDLHFL